MSKSRAQKDFDDAAVVAKFAEDRSAAIRADLVAVAPNVAAPVEYFGAAPCGYACKVLKADRAKNPLGANLLCDWMDEVGKKQNLKQALAR